MEQRKEKRQKNTKQQYVRRKLVSDLIYQFTDVYTNINQRTVSPPCQFIYTLVSLLIKLANSVQLKGSVLKAKTNSGKRGKYLGI